MEKTYWVITLDPLTAVMSKRLIEAPTKAAARHRLFTRKDFIEYVETCGRSIDMDEMTIVKRMGADVLLSEGRIA